MAISSVSSSTNVPQSSAGTQPQATQPQQTSDKTDAGKSDSDKSASTPAPTVLTQGTGTAHHHKKKIHHPLPGQPGYQVNKKA